MTALTFTLIALTLLALTLFSDKSGLVQRLRPRPSLPKRTASAPSLRDIDVLLEIPDFASLIGFAVAAGESLETGLRIAVQRSSGFLSQEFSFVIRNVDHGAVLQIELERMSRDSQSKHVSELALKLALASTNGSAVSDLIGEYVQSSVQELKSTLLESAGKNETKMMIPLVFVILPITVMFAVYPSLNLLQNSFL
ncbi:MAG: type II secretion system F family protein [Actinomycetes bacterium]